MKRVIPLCLLLFPVFLNAQEPVSWTNTVKKINANTYEIHFKATVGSPWHLYSQKTPVGGPLPTSIHFTKNPVTVLAGPVKENGKLIKKHEEVFDIDVMYYNNEVDFVQTVTVKGDIKTKIGGTIKFMACNDSQCLPPSEIKFQLPLQ